MYLAVDFALIENVLISVTDSQYIRIVTSLNLKQHLHDYNTHIILSKEQIFSPQSHSQDRREIVGNLFISMLGDFSDSESPKIASARDTKIRWLILRPDFHRIKKC